MTDRYDKWKASMRQRAELKGKTIEQHMSDIARKNKGVKKPTSGTASLSKEDRIRRASEASRARWDKRK